MRILHVAAEVHPLIKTGGLADVVGALPAAQKALGHDVALLVPGYPQVLAGAGELREQEVLDIPGGRRARFLRGRLGKVDLLVLDQPYYFDRPGNPYGDEYGNAWPDNHLRFALLSRAAAYLCRQDRGIDVLHAHDWHTGLAPAYARDDRLDCSSCFTIHNLAYQGLYGPQQFDATGLPWEFYRFDGLEYHGNWSFMKAGLTYCDAITAVSPTYAREILQPDLGMGLHELLNHRRHDLHGILNGVDYDIWNPATDRQLDKTYSIDSLQHKIANKRGLQKNLGLAQADSRLLIGVVSRLTRQKGLDLVVDAIEGLLATEDLQLVLLGGGESSLETAFARLAERYPRNCAVRIGYDEALAHRIVGSADAILVPSRFEPCGLTQLYGLRYGSLPIVRKTGGLADTVVGEARDAAGATGFVFEKATALALKRQLGQAIGAYREPVRWKKMMRNGMRCDFSWDKSAQAYIDLYRQISKR